MTVGELRRALEAFPDECQVITSDPGSGYCTPVISVRYGWENTEDCARGVTSERLSDEQHATYTVPIVIVQVGF